MYDQMFNILIKLIFSKFQCGFCKGFNTPKLSLIHDKTWKESLDQGGHYYTLLTDLPKTFGCMMHDLLLVKLQAYRFDNGF